MGELLKLTNGEVNSKIREYESERNQLIITNKKIFRGLPLDEWYTVGPIYRQFDIKRTVNGVSIYRTGLGFGNAEDMNDWSLKDLRKFDKIKEKIFNEIPKGLK